MIIMTHSAWNIQKHYAKNVKTTGTFSRNFILISYPDSKMWCIVSNNECMQNNTHEHAMEYLDTRW